MKKQTAVTIYNQSRRTDFELRVENRKQWRRAAEANNIYKHKERDDSNVFSQITKLSPILTKRQTSELYKHYCSSQ